MIIVFIAERSLEPTATSSNQHHKKRTCIDYRKLNSTMLLQTQGDQASHPSHNSTLTIKTPRLHLPPRHGHGHGEVVAMSPQDEEGVEKFVFFIGYPRSGHSIVGSMMDAHPNMIIAHEYNLFREWDKFPKKHSHRSFLYNGLYSNSVMNAERGRRSNSQAYKGYTLGLDYPWQAHFKDLRVIGDKSGAITSQLFIKDPARFKEILELLRETVRIPILVIHVVRNPYDMISTRLLYSDSPTKKTKLPATSERKHCNPYGLEYHINRTFHIIDSVQQIMNSTNLTVLDVHHADLVRRTRETVIMICRFLGLPCPSDYLDACERKCYKMPAKTRLLVEWPEEMVEDVYELSKPYRFLWRYSFNGD